MFKSLLGAAALAVVTTPVYAPAPAYVIDNQSKNTLVWVNKATDEETFIQPYTQVNVSSLTGYALSCIYDNGSTLMFAVDKGGSSDRYYTKDVDIEDGQYTDFMAGDTKVTVYDVYYSGDVWLNLDINTDPFSDDFYYMFGLNESNYRAMGSTGLVRSCNLFNGNFILYGGNLPSAYNVQYSGLIAFANVFQTGSTYKRENVRAAVSLYAIRSSGLKAVEIASNYSQSSYGVYEVPTLGTALDGYSIYGYEGSNSDMSFRSMTMNFGLSNNIWSAGFSVSTPEQARMLTYRDIGMTIPKTQTEEVLDDFFTLMAKAFAVLIPFLGVVVLPGVTVGLLLFIPLFVALIIALIKMIKK